MNIFDLFKTAQEKLKWPKLVLPVPMKDGEKIIFRPAKYENRLNMYIQQGKNPTDWIGRLIRNDEKRVIQFEYNPAVVVPQEHKALIREAVKNPIGLCSVLGQQFSYCCFCSTEITTKESLSVGYGPICAEKWGLPWGEIDKVKLENL